MYVSCDYLQGGLALRLGSAAACGVIHHGRGTPVLGAFDGKPADLDELLRIRRSMVAGTDPACAGCPYLKMHEWPEPTHLVDWLGITHFNTCNLECEYCWLQWAPYSPRRPGVHDPKAYAIYPIVEELVNSGMLAPTAIVDWGGGGESTLMPDFDETFELLDAHGTSQWLHTNAVRVPKGLEGAAPRSRLRVLCSVDAGRRETYAAIKVRDRLDLVLENLKAYSRAGAYVAAKYIVTERNADFDEIDAFYEAMRDVRPDEILADIDLRFPDSKPSIVEALGYLRLRAADEQIPFQFGSTGVNHAREYDLPARSKIAAQRLKKRRGPHIA